LFLGNVMCRDFLEFMMGMEAKRQWSLLQRICT
jgi:hypothetical protein